MDASFFPFLIPIMDASLYSFLFCLNYVQGTIPSYEQRDLPNNPSVACTMSANNKPQQSWYSFHDTNGMGDQ